MIIYRIFSGFLWRVLCCFLHLFMVLQRALLSTLPTPVSFLQTRPAVLHHVLLHSGETPFIPVCTEVVCPPFACRSSPLSLNTMVASCSRPRSRAAPPLLPLRILSASPEILAAFPCFNEVPLIYGDNFHRFERESPSPFGHFLPTAN